ncbi:ABC transporter substrate-binding protein [Angustibacter sp. McL0619]|uniref:ABC transporter substrate-binding protein n=1 Tax=Angustibacter sp. McL0619 TaxID=3415676 RepID=UPI003CF517BF
MSIPMKRRSLAIAVAGLASALAVTACSAGSLKSGGDDKNGATTLSFLVDNSDSTVKTAQGLADAFHAKNPNITIKLEQRPGGGDGDNLIKTRLSTGDMNDVFMYNSGSLFQAIDPAKNLVPQTSQPWLKDVEPSFQTVVKAGSDIYGAPFGVAMGGGILYNKAIYSKLGLSVPKTWADYMSNNAKVKAAGIVPVIQTYADTWTSQLYVLADFHNVAAAQADWATKYTQNQAHYVDDPALLGFQRLQAVHDAGYLNKNYGSEKFEQGLKDLADGKGSSYPMLTFGIGTIQAQSPDKIKDIGFFPQPGDDAAKNGLTLWLPPGIYIPKTTTGAKLTAAEKFLGFAASKEGCDAQTKGYPPAGPYVVTGCTLPGDVPDAVKDLSKYAGDSDNVTPALEFLSPIKGPALEQITVEVGSGLKKAPDGAALYDKDVKKQAQQLGLPGWS